MKVRAKRIDVVVLLKSTKYLAYSLLTASKWLTVGAIGIGTGVSKQREEALGATETGDAQSCRLV